MADDRKMERPPIVPEHLRLTRRGTLSHIPFLRRMAIKKSILRKIAKIQAQLHDLSDEMMETCDEMRGKLDDKPVKYIDSEK